jgi:hypothetical protein
MLSRYIFFFNFFIVATGTEAQVSIIFYQTITYQKQRTTSVTQPRNTTLGCDACCAQTQCILASYTNRIRTNIQEN